MSMSSKCSPCSHSFLQDQIPHFHLSTRHQSSSHSTTQDNCRFSLPFTTLLSPPTLAWLHLSLHHVTRRPTSHCLFCKIWLNLSTILLHILQIYLSPSARCQHTLKVQLSSPSARPQDIHHSTNLQMMRKSRSRYCDFLSVLLVNLCKVYPSL